VTPDVIADVAKEFRLGVVRAPEVDRSQGNNDMDIRRAITVLLDMYAALQTSVDSDLDIAITTEAKQS
jgi:hypothetical protein